MRSSHKSLLLLAFAVPLAGGCSSLFGRTATLKTKPPEQTALALAEAAHLAAGRAALDRGNHAEAITAFRYARTSPVHAADATNGLGVAYSNIGRPDLAERYFRQAMAMEPRNPRFAANLDRLLRANAAFAARSAPAEPAAPGPVQSFVQMLFGHSGGAAIRVEMPQTRMTRVSGNEVRLGETRLGETRLGTGGAGAARPGGAQPARAAVRFELPVTGASRSYPVRVTVAPAVTEANRYPLRIGLTARAR
jgi:hypothetical protein